METTVGQLLLNEALPEEMRDYNRVWDKKSLKGIMTEIAEKYPDKYSEITQRLHTLSSGVVTTFGGVASLSLDSLRTPPEAEMARTELRKKIDKIAEGPGSHESKNKKILELIGDNIDKMTELNYKAALKGNNPLATQILSGSRGNPSQFKSLTFGDMIFTDHKDKPIPIAILKSFSEGLDPVEYWAGAYSSRKGSVSTKFCLGGDVEVLLPDMNFKSIKSIIPGDVIMGSDKLGYMYPVKVKNVFFNGDKECCRYYFRRTNSKLDFSIIATPDHEVLGVLKKDYNPGYNPEKGSIPSLRKLEKFEREYHAIVSRGMAGGSINEPRALLLGLLLGNGCLRSVGCITFSSDDRLMMTELEPYFNSFNLKANKAKGKNYNYYLAEISRSKFIYDRETRGVKTGNPVKMWLKEIGTWGKLAHEKSFPKDVWDWDDKSVSELLGGLFSTDGSIYLMRKGTLVFRLCLTSYAMVYQSKELLEKRFGIYCTDIRKVCMERIEWAKHDQFEFGIALPYSIMRLKEKIPFYGKKRETFDECFNVWSKERSKRISEPGYKMTGWEPVGEVETFDLEVEGEDHLFVLKDGLIVSNSTPKAGFLGKQLVSAAHRLIVTEKDCGTQNGIVVERDDPDNEGAVLARDYGAQKAGSVLSPRSMHSIKNKQIVVRSPMTCQATNGVCQRCAGIRETGDFPPLNSNLGVSAGQAVSEPIGQGQLSVKHTSGKVRKATDTKSGLDLINQLVQVPKTFQGGAAISTVDGRIEQVENAPQGGLYVTIGGQQHWVPPEDELTVKKGDMVEAGDVITTGIPNPAEITRYKGIGEGRRYFADLFRKTLVENKFPAHRRNVELIARGLINHVRVTDLDGPEGTVPDDVVEYDTLVRGYQPRYGTKPVKPKQGIGLYLEQPVLHYSIGTRLTPRVVKQLEEQGVDRVSAHADPPSFIPEMTRAMETLAHSDDWMVRLGGFHLKKSLTEAVHRGRESQEHGTSYIPSLAKGVEFGKVTPGAGY